MFQTWNHLLFLHWRWNADEIQATLPKGLTVETFDGDAWLGLVPFYMRYIRPRRLPWVPWISNFLELNVRTYVRDAQGRPGVWFYSLDCNQPLAVWTARTFFHLPYQHARMRSRIGADGFVNYACHRRGLKEGSSFRYKLSTETTHPEPGSLEFFLVERYLLFANTARGMYVGRVYHTPYPVAQAEVTNWDPRILEANGFTNPGRPPDHICGSPGVKVQIYGLVL